MVLSAIIAAGVLGQATYTVLAAPTQVATGYQFLEGPIWTRRGTLIFSDIPANKMYELAADGSVKVFRDPSGNANGNNLDRQGNLYTAHHGTRNVTKTVDGKMTTLAERWESKRLNSPNDLVVRRFGTVYFTDPPYGIQPNQAELGFNAVWRVTPKGELTPLVRDFDRPNGLAFSPDEKRLYVADTGRRHIRVFEVQPDGGLANGRVFHTFTGDLNWPDGMRVDSKGRIYCTVNKGVAIIEPNGRMTGLIPTPVSATNCAWGGKDAKTLYITAGPTLWSAKLDTVGVSW